MRAAIVNLSIEQGVDWSQDFVFYSDTEQTQKVDFSGLTGRSKIRDMEGNVVATPTVTFPESGTIRMSLTNAQTSAIPVTGVSYSDTAECVYDVETVATVGGAVARWLNGTVTVSPEVTK